MNLAICGILFRRVAAVCVRHPGIVRIDAKNELRGWAVWLTIFWLVAAGQSAWAQASMTLNISPAHPTDTDSRTLAQSETASLTINVAAKGMANGVNYILKSGPDFTLDSTSPEFVWTGARGSYWIVNTSPQSAVASVTARCVWTPAPPSGGGLAKGGYSPPLPPDIEGLAVGTAFALPGGEYWNEADTNILCVYETTLVRAYENDEPAESDWSIAGPGEILGATNGVDTVVVKGTEASTSMWDLVVTSVSCASGASDTEYLTVVGVKGLEYWRVKERVWAELPEPLCVGLGANVYFRALKQPAVAPWPAGKPVWEGAIGSGERASRTFTNAGMHYVYAECGNTVTGAIYVVSNYTIIASSVYIGLSNTVTASAWTVDAHGAAVKTNSNWSIPEGYAQAKFMVESELLTKAVDVDTVTLLGLAASATLGDIRVHACAAGDSEICDDEWFTVIEADLDADINMDCGIDASDDPDEDAAEKPGLLVGVNNNTHALEDGLTEVDYADDIINGEEDRNDDLKVLKLALHPAMTNGNLVLRCAGNSSVRIFDETDTAVIGPGLGMEHTIPASNVPPAGLEYRIEALEGGREVTVELEYQLPGGGAVCDKVKVSTVNMTGVDGYCFGSLNKTKVVAIPDSAGRATDKCYAIPDKLGPENPAEVLVRLEPAEGKEITWLTYGLLGLPYDGQPGGGIGVYDEMSRQWVAPLGIRDAATGAGAVPLYYALTYDEVFWQIVVWLQDLWDNEDPWAHTMFSQRPTAGDVYNYVLAYLNIAPGDVWYYWQMPTITTTGDKLFNIVNYDPVSIISDIKFTILRVDLDIDVDDDGDVDDTDEAKEETPGVIIFENWDNDDGDAAHTPDKDETSVTGKNDLVPFYPKLEPTLTTGTLKLEATAGGSRVKVWTSATKGTEITLPKTWDLATETVPATLYLEGYDESASANDVELKLSYANGGSSICDDKLKITVVRQNLGVAVYRDLDMPWPWTPLGHAGLITGYTGKRTKVSLTNEANWVTTEMGTAGIHTSTLQTFIATRPPFRGSCSVANLTDTLRNEILGNANDCLTAGIAYLWGDAISWNGPTWDGTIADIHELRCDGLVEVCYELAGLEVWGQNGTHYPIQTWPDEHQNLGMGNPQVELSPVVQRGGVANSPTRFVADVLFQPQTLP